MEDYVDKRPEIGNLNNKCENIKFKVTRIMLGRPNWSVVLTFRQDGELLSIVSGETN